MRKMLQSMNIKRKLTYLSALLLLLTRFVPAEAQVYYSCDFETAQQRQSWTLSQPGETPCPNNWYIGKPGNFSQYGGNGLFISTDGQAANYVSSGQAMYTVAYDTLTLQTGSYTLDFDWRLLGNGASANLFVMWVPNTEQDATMESYVGFADNPFYGSYKLNTTGLRSNAYWTPVRINFTVTAATAGKGKLCFVFSSAHDNGKPGLPSACVDNIVIHAPTNCPKPTGLKYDKKTMALSWNSTGSEWQVLDYCAYENTVVEYNSVTTKSLMPKIEGEGIHLFYVRTVCGDGSYSEWVSVQEFVWIPGKRCIDYLDIGNPNAGTAGKCYHGGWNDVLAGPGSSTGGKVDNGNQNSKTLHCIHMDPFERDARTMGGLKCVPDGELASVRIGAFERSQDAAFIEYRYAVPRGASQLLDINYAAVLEWGHSDIEYNARFDIQVLDSKNNPIGGCTQKTFYAGDTQTSSSSNWHVIEGGATSYSTEPIYWSDWQKVTISLVDFPGQTLTIRIIVPTCQAQYHWAYAYFTINCRDGGLEGIACGDTSTDHFTAPDNFTYKWYLASDATKSAIRDSVYCRGVLPYTTDNGQTLHIDSLTSEVFHVECHDKQDNSCYYTLTANPNPRYPVAEIDTILVQSANCTNLVRFKNDAHISIISRKDSSETHTDELPEDIYWTFGDGMAYHSFEEYVTHEYPVTGGTFRCVAYVSMSNGICMDSAEFVFNLPDLIHTGTIVRTDVAVRQTYTSISGKQWYAEVDTMFVDSLMKPNQYGCQAPYYEYIYYHSAIRDSLHYTMCEGDSIQFEVGDTVNGYHTKVFYASTLDSALYRTGNNVDSLRYLDLYVIPHMAYNVPDTVEICGDNGAEIHIPYGLGVGSDQYLGVEVLFDNLGIAAGFDSSYVFGPGQDIVIPIPDYLRPNYYPIRLQPRTPRCPVEEQAVTAIVHYTSAIFDQLDGFIGLLNDRYNYGEFEYLTYRWYRDGELMVNDTLSYIHTTMDDLKHEFYVEVTRADDGVVLTSCPVEYVGHPMGVDDVEDAVRVSPTLVDGGAHLTVTGRGMVRVVDLLGRTYEQFRTGTVSNSTVVVNAPKERGVYFVVFENHDAVKIIVR